MKKVDESEMEDELRPEYNIKSLRVRRLGSERKSFGGTINTCVPTLGIGFE